MSSNRPALHPYARWPDRFGIHENRIGLPSWAVSVVVHAGLLVVFAMSLKSCSSGIPSVSEGEFRDVGIYVKTNKTQATSQESLADQNDASSQSTTFSNSDPLQDTATTNDVAVESLLDLPPMEAPPIIGPGGAAAQNKASDISSGVVANQGSSASAPALASGNGETSFFDIRDNGQKFLYVVDSSGSMTNHNAILSAKAELKASLQSLDATQQFHIIFYNRLPHEMPLRPGKPQLSWATEINRTLARQFIDRIQPDGATAHMPALRRALQYAPDVIFFLTDGNEPAPETSDLEDIMATNKGRTRIHCIEFGEGPQLSIDNFIKKLARQNGGTYRYRDVSAADTRRKTPR